MEFSEQQIEVTYISILIKLLVANRIKVILAGWPDVANYFNDEVPEKAFYCPYPFSEEYLYFKGVTETLVKEPNSVGVFLPCAPRKNTLNQILAAIKSGMKIYTNLPYDFQNTNVNKVGWLSNTEYFKLISRLTLTLHCTFTESFSYGAVESLMLGTLPIVSIQICDNMNLSGSVICCGQCDSVTEILNKINYIKNMPELAYEYQIKKCQTNFRFKNELNLKITKDVLDKVTNLVVK